LYLFVSVFRLLYLISNFKFHNCL